MGTGRTLIRGVDLAWESTGNGGRPLIWAHGLHSSRADESQFGFVDWSALPDDVDVFRYDARGHGESGGTADPSASSWDNMARDQLGLATSLGIDSYVAGGASLGAATALHAAVLEPERVRKLVLVIPPTGWETRAAQADFYESVAQLVEAEGVQPVVDGAANLPVPDPFAGSDDWLQRRVDALLSADPVRIVNRFRGATTANLPSREAVRGIDAPTLILAWTGDPSHPISSSEELLELLPSATLHVASTMQDLEAWTDAVAGFVSQSTAET